MSSTVLSRLQLRFRKYQVLMASVLFFIPLILIKIQGEVLPSISAYYYMDNYQWFVSLLTIASMMYANSGVHDNRKWYNILLGLSLWVVVMAPYDTWKWTHFTAAGIFFIGSEIVMIYDSNKEQRKYMWMLGFVINLGMAGHFVFGWYSLLVAEWIGLMPITAHFIGESLGKIK